MSKKEEKDKQENGSFSDSAEMFDTLFREAIPKEKEGGKTEQEEEKRLSDSDELLVSAFKEDIEPGKGTPQRAAASAGGTPKKAPRQQGQAQEGESPDRKKDKFPPARRPGETGPSREAGKPVPQAKAPSRWNPVRLGLAGLGVLLLVGGLLVYFGLFDSSQTRHAPPPMKPAAKKEILPPPAPPKPEVKREPAQVPPAAPPLQAKPQPAAAAIPEAPAPSLPKQTTTPAVPKTLAPAEPSSKTAGAAPPQTGVAPPKTVPYPYSVYLGSFRDRERLQKAVSIFQGKGLAPYWCRFDLGEKGMWFRVFAGHFRTREEADRVIREKGIQEAESRETKYAALIGVYGSKEELDRKVSQLKGLGLGPYVIQDGEAAARLYVGAFFQESHAAEQVKELASRGIQSRVVER